MNYAFPQITCFVEVISQACGMLLHEHVKRAPVGILAARSHDNGRNEILQSDVLVNEEQVQHPVLDEICKVINAFNRSQHS